MRVATIIISETGKGVEVIAIIMEIYLTFACHLVLMNLYNRAIRRRGLDAQQDVHAGATVAGARLKEGLHVAYTRPCWNTDQCRATLILARSCDDPASVFRWAILDSNWGNVGAKPGQNRALLGLHQRQVAADLFGRSHTRAMRALLGHAELRCTMAFTADWRRWRARMPVGRSPCLAPCPAVLRGAHYCGSLLALCRDDR